MALLDILTADGAGSFLIGRGDLGQIEDFLSVTGFIYQNRGNFGILVDVLRGDDASVELLLISPAVSPGGTQIKYWTGSVWEEKPLKHWDGAQWVFSTIKRWNSTDWVDI